MSLKRSANASWLWTIPGKRLPYFLKACEILAQDPWLPEQEPERLARMKKIGEGKW